jgi:exonuclease SbcC
VRPTSLTVQGLTAYRQPVEIDFENLDLFAITGPTGAGKSSLVDAITFALFGKAPRVKGDVKDLISQGENQLKVDLYFRTNGNLYRVHRSTARKGQARVQFEHLDPATDAWQPLEDRVREANAHIERVLQMDYEAFVRSVLLPQGEFQEFLAGDRDQRRKVLDGLLQLDVYQRIQQRASAIDRDKTAESDAHHRRLDTDLAGATPEALKGAKSQLKELKSRADELLKLRGAAEAAARLAEALAGARRREREAVDKLESAREALERAQHLLDKGTVVLAGLDAQVAAVAEEVKAVAYDADLHLRLTKCLPVLKQVDEANAEEAKLSRDIESKKHALEKLRADAATAKERFSMAAQEALARHDEYEAARQTNATALLRQNVRKGDPCPVCGQPAPDLPNVKSVTLDKPKAAWEKAQAAEKAANDRVGDIDRRLAVEENGLQSAETQLAELRKRRISVAAEVAATLDDPRATTATVQEQVMTLDKARAARERLDGQRAALVAQRDTEAKSIEAARNDVTKLEHEARACGAEVERAGREIAEVASSLLQAATTMGWDDVSSELKQGKDVAPLLKRRAGEVESEEREVLTAIGATGKQIEHLEADIETARDLRAKEKACRAEAMVARDLASLLQVNRFPAFLRERAMSVLAEAGSERLREISGGRYDLIADGQDFAVEDLWNASEPRPVRTLSGGETFLASLALALALAEHLPALAGNAHRISLESLFIDEGFSNLDAETLDTVASALEVLGQDRGRLIGVVTHVPALAERMPARIVVHKSQSGSTVTVE